MKKHTPPPWRVVEDYRTTYDDDEVRCVRGPSNEVIVVEPFQNDYYESCVICTPEGTAANLQLVAAAPLLLAALKALVSAGACDRDDPDAPQWAQAEAAIAAAER